VINAFRTCVAKMDHVLRSGLGVHVQRVQHQFGSEGEPPCTSRPWGLQASINRARSKDLAPAGTWMMVATYIRSRTLELGMLFLPLVGGQLFPLLGRKAVEPDALVGIGLRDPVLAGLASRLEFLPPTLQAFGRYGRGRPSMIELNRYVGRDFGILVSSSPYRIGVHEMG
jgi:hypothetical protein